MLTSVGRFALAAGSRFDWFVAPVRSLARPLGPPTLVGEFVDGRLTGASSPKRGIRIAWIAHVFGRDTLWAGYSPDGDEHPAQNAE
jgi:hypothetical protein